MKIINNISLLFLLIATIIGCKPEIEVPAPGSGNASFTEYVAMGNSLTAGYSNGGLYLEVQEQSFPAILAEQLMEVNSGLTFSQPLMPPGNGSGYLELKTLDLANEIFDFTIVPPAADWTNKITGTYQNLGIPGIRVRDITVNGYGASATQGNPYFYRILAESEANKSYLDVVGAANPSFFTLWLGANDVLGYASSGGAYGIEGIPGTGINGLTPIDDFEASYAALMNLLNSKNASGVILDIPDITNIPFFTLIAWNALELTAAQAEEAGAGYEAMIEPQVEAGVKEGTINLVATDTVLSVGVLPDLADTAVFQQYFAQVLASGADSATALSMATDYLASAEGQAASAALETQLNAELPAHLLGEDTDPELDPLFDIIDLELATNAQLQQAIAQTVTQITEAYNAGLLPELEAVVEQQTAAQIAALKAAGFYPSFAEGENGFVIEVPKTQVNPLGLRQMVEGELILFTAVAEGELNPDKAAMPKPDQYILTLEEVANIEEYRDQFNEIIAGYASNNVAVINADDILAKYNAGVFVDGVELTGDYIQGGIFSLDAVHLTPRGNAVIANEVIQVLNEKFNASVPPVNVSDFEAVILP